MFFKWFQPLFENDGAAGGSATSEGASATEDGGDPTNGSGENQDAEPAGADLTWIKDGPIRDAVKAAGLLKPTDLAKDWQEQKGKLEKATKQLETAIVPPGEDASDKEKAAYFERIGVPASPDKYELEHVDLPETLVYDEEFEKWYRGVAHELRLSKDQAVGLHLKYMQRLVEQHDNEQEQLEQKRDEFEGKLKEKLGEGEYNTRMARARRAIRVFGSEEFDDFLDESGLADDPRMIGFSMNLGSLISDDSISIASAGAGASEPTDPNDPDSWDLSESEKSLPKKE